MKISVIVPVRNEEDTIRDLLDSLFTQSLLPEEVVITDGGSTDATPAIIDEYLARGLPIKLIRTKAALPGRGRNLAAAQASNQWLAFTDAGIRPQKTWLEELARATTTAINEGPVQVVFGSYEPITDTMFKECAAITYVPPPSTKNGGLIRPPSIVSALMKSSVWKDVGGFPENLRSAEDLLFMNKIEAAGFRVKYAPAAVVHWHMQPDLRRTFNRFVVYARNNLRAGLWRQWQAAIFRRYILIVITGLPAIAIGPVWLLVPLVLWLLLLTLRAAVAIRRNRYCYPAGLGRNLVRMLVIVPLIAVLDAAAFLGSAQWFLKEKLQFDFREKEVPVGKNKE